MIGLHIDFGGLEDFYIESRGKVWKFEWHPYSGPIVLGRNGDPTAHQPIHVLTAASLWAQQGKRVEEGRCVWTPEPDPTEGFVKIPGTRQWVRPETLARFRAAGGE